MVCFIVCVLAAHSVLSLSCSPSMKEELMVRCIIYHLLLLQTASELLQICTISDSTSAFKLPCTGVEVEGCTLTKHHIFITIQHQNSLIHCNT